jgi:Rad3-related DNA helicase
MTKSPAPPEEKGPGACGNGARAKATPAEKCSPTRSTIQEWEKFFPRTNEGIRESQRTAIEAFLSQIDQTTNFLLQAPTGVGKSFIAVTLGFYLAATRTWKTRITVPNLFLENQYINEFQHLGVVQLHSARHYDCEQFGKCNIGFLYQRKYCSNCPYIKARKAYEQAPVAITNLAFALTCARHQQDLGPCDLQIIDEIHQLENIICGLYDLKVPLTNQAAGKELNWLKETFLPQTQREILRLEARARLSEEIQAKIARLEEQAANAEAFITSKNPPIIARNNQYLTFQPIDGRNFAPQLLDRIAPRRLMMSATILHSAMHLYYLGLNRPKNYNRQKFLTSPFPSQHRLLRPWPILKWPAGKIENWPSEIRESFGEKLADAVEHILSLHPDQRGLIHCVSYERGAFLMEELRTNERLLFHQPTNFDYACKRHRLTLRSVLVSPRALEGVDFKGEDSEFQIFLKIPFPSLGDARIKHRLNQPTWYSVFTTINFLQGAGRSVRCEGDIAPTYILDLDWVWWSKSVDNLLPPYIKDAIKPYSQESLCLTS